MHSQTPSANARIVAFDLFAFVALAGTIALATAAVLIATVLLLAGRAEAAPATGTNQAASLLRSAA